MPFSMTDQPHGAYPRPQLVRDSYLCLNGRWDFCVTRDDRLPDAFPLSILVPFPPESEASGIGRRIDAGERMWYRRTFTLPKGFRKGRVILRFGAVDQRAEVYLNGRHMMDHEGGYLPFSCDITEALEAENVLVVKAVDALDHAYPWGKQKRNNGGMWYTPFSGIWQTVWLESVPDAYITGLRITPSLDSANIEITANGEPGPAEICVRCPDGEITRAFEGGRVTLTIPDPIHWSPENPHLYPFTVTMGEDRVKSYFALRTIHVAVVDGLPRLCLNGRPYFFHGLLDQGYWPGGICLPPDSGGYERDVQLAKSLGFNTLRKHIRVEPMAFYHACDRLGMVVFQDFVNNGEYSFIRDTALPTIGIRSLPDRGLNRNTRSRALFERSARETVEHLYNCPSVLYWTIFNEGWGQHEADRYYGLVREMDPTRIVDATSGWFRQHDSDVDSIHVYFRPFKQKKGTRPMVLSEFGGYGCSAGGKQYGYRFFDTEEKYRAALIRLYEREIVPAIGEGLCAAIYTQLTDIEEEKNGLCTYDRSKVKVEAGEMLRLAERLNMD